MTPAIEVQLDDRAARERIRTSLDESLHGGGLGRNRQNHRADRAHRSCAGQRADHDRPHRRGDIHQQSRRRVEAAFAPGTRSRAQRRCAIPPNALNIENALEHLEEASIGTIHSFCAQILRERPVEAVVDPAFEELSEEQASRIYERAFRAWMQRKLGEGAPGLRRALVRLAWRDSFERASPIEQLQYAAWKLIEWRDHPAPWRRVEFRREAEIDRLVGQVELIAEAASRCAEAQRQSGEIAPAGAGSDHLDRARGSRRRRATTIHSKAC